MKLPCEECRGRCCYLAPFTRREFKTVRKKHGIPAGAQLCLSATHDRATYFVVQGDEGMCGYLVDGRCSIWQDRPEVCRRYGVVAEMPCQYLYPEAARLHGADLDNMKRAWRLRDEL